MGGCQPSRQEEGRTSCMCLYMSVFSVCVVRVWDGGYVFNKLLGSRGEELMESMKLGI